MRDARVTYVYSSNTVEVGEKVEDMVPSAGGTVRCEIDTGDTTWILCVVARCLHFPCTHS